MLTAAGLLPVVLLLLLLGENRNIIAQSSTPVASEYNLKLAHIYKTAKYITWPNEAAEAQKPFVIGVFSPEPFQGGLEKLASLRKLKDRPISVVMIRSVQDFQPCHVLFIPVDADATVVNSILSRTLNQPILVWRDQPDSTFTAGTSCTFVFDADKLIIEADPAELKRRNLAPDGQLMSLNMVRSVKPRKPSPVN